MNDDQYLHHCRDSLKAFSADLLKRCEYLPEDDSLRQLAESFGSIAATAADLYAETPALVSRLFTTYPDFGPLFPRHLLWFLGGECLHYMPDEEIDQYRQLDDLRLESAARGETLDLSAARAKLLKLQ